MENKSQENTSHNAIIFALLKKEDIECKGELVNTNIKISLHVKAATCTRLLNETVGTMNWEKEYTNGNKNCIVRIWDDKKQRMISKEDCGGGLTEIDGYKGQASNGFKRACALGWGLGIELYSQPLILIPANNDNTVYNNRGMTVSEEYSVADIQYNDDRKIVRCVLKDSKGNIVYDGPDENGMNRIGRNYEAEAQDDVIIPENADEMNAEDDMEEVEDCDVDLPDNTDGMTSDDADANYMQPVVPPYTDTDPIPFFASEETVDYEQIIESEIKRTNVRHRDVMRSLNVNNPSEINQKAKEDFALVDGVIKRLKSRKTYNTN